MRGAFGLILGAAIAAALVPSLAATTTTGMLSCKGRVVWIVSTTPAKMYVLSNNPRYGKKPGWHACESSVTARGYHMRPLQTSMHAATIHKNVPAPRSPMPNASTSSPMPNASASPGATPAVRAEDPAVTKLARAQIDIIRSGKLDRTQYGASLNAVLTDKVIAQLSQFLTLSGAVTSFNYAGTVSYHGLPIAQYAVTFEKAIAASKQLTTNQWVESISTDPAGKVVYLVFVPKT